MVFSFLCKTCTLNVSFLIGTNIFHKKNVGAALYHTALNAKLVVTRIKLFTVSQNLKTTVIYLFFLFIICTLIKVATTRLQVKECTICNFWSVKKKSITSPPLLIHQIDEHNRNTTENSPLMKSQNVLVVLIVL